MVVPPQRPARCSDEKGAVKSAKKSASLMWRLFCRNRPYHGPGGPRAPKHRSPATITTTLTDFYHQTWCGAARQPRGWAPKYHRRLKSTEIFIINHTRKARPGPSPAFSAPLHPSQCFQLPPIATAPARQPRALFVLLIINPNRNRGPILIS